MMNLYFFIRTIIVISYIGIQGHGAEGQHHVVSLHFYVFFLYITK